MLVQRVFRGYLQSHFIFSIHFHFSIFLLPHSHYIFIKYNSHINIAFPPPQKQLLRCFVETKDEKNDVILVFSFQ